MATLVVSDSPGSLSGDVSTGTHKRLQVFLDALAEKDGLEFLFYIPPDAQCLGAMKEKIQSRLSDRYGCCVPVALCRRRSRPYNTRGWFSELSGMWNFLHLIDYYAVSGPAQVQAFEEHLSRRPARLFIHRLAGMGPVLKSRSTLPPTFFDLDDVEHVAYIRSLRQPPHWRSKWLRYSSVPALILGERKAISKAQATLVCSEVDREYLSGRLGLTGVHVVPNTVRIPAVTRVSAEPTVLFMGNFAYPPNAVAATFLIERIWPAIRAWIPNAQLLIAGPAQHAISTYARPHPNVVYLGFVQDLDELYGRARVVVAPILSGAGTRVKIVEAAAYGKPIVATRLGAEGLVLKHGEEILIQDDAAAFANACVMLLRDYELCERLGMRAREVAVDEYDVDRAISKIKSVIFPSATERKYQN